MARHDKEIFKEELAGTFQKEMFKAQLAGKPMIVNAGLKLIMPLTEYTNLTSFVDKVEEFDGMEWSHTRRQNGTLCYTGYPVLEKITEDGFVLWDGWRIYKRCHSFMKCAGWAETNENHSLSNAFNLFVPLGMYSDGSYIEVEKNGGDVTKHPLPPYHEGGKTNNGFIIDTTYSTKIAYCYDAQIAPGQTQAMRSDLIKNLGIDKQYLATKGQTVRFPASQ